MPITYKLITTLLAFTGCGSLFISGELNIFLTVGGLAMIPGYYNYIRSDQSAPRWVISALSVLTLVVFIFDSMAISGDVFLAVAHLTIAFQGIKSFDLREPWDNLQVFFMALLQLIIASEMVHSIIFGVIFVLFMFMLITAMVLSHFLKEGIGRKFVIRGPVMAISAATLIATVLLFVAIPRTSYRFFGKSHSRGIKVSGFSENVTFGAVGEVKLDPTVVMRIEIGKNAPERLYWRGVTLDYFDGSSWHKTIPEGRRIEKVKDEFLLAPYDRARALEQTIFLEPIESDIVFGLSEVRGISADVYAMVVDSGGDISVPRKSSRRITYTVYSYPGDRVKGGYNPKHLQFPSGLERVARLAADVAAGAKSEKEKASLIEQYLRTNYVYSLDAGHASSAESAVDDFLFTTRRGFCEHYSTSMALMLRSLGVPARIVNGYYGGKRNDYGGYIIVSQSNAHSWVEAYVEGAWQRFDPTPQVAESTPSMAVLIMDSLVMNWYRYVVGFSSKDQKSILRGLSQPVEWVRPFGLKLPSTAVSISVFVLLVVLILTGYFMTKVIYRKKADFITINYLRIQRLLSKKGIPITPATTSGRIRRLMSNRVFKAELNEFLDSYEQYRFGRKAMTAEDRKRYISLFDAIRNKLKQEKFSKN